MAADLVQRLRTCSAEERRAIAMELAITRKETALTELKWMVEGGSRGSLRWYNYDDQLIGIEALRETGTGEALEFLCKVYSSVFSFSTGDSHSNYETDSGYGVTVIYDVARITFRFPWAKKNLRRRLAYSAYYDFCPEDSRSTTEAELRELFSKEPHSTIRRAIRELEVVTGKTTQIVTKDSWWRQLNPLNSYAGSGYPYDTLCKNVENYAPEKFLRV